MLSRAAFTLVELVAVVLVLGVLAAVAAPKMFDATARAQASTELQTARIVLGAAHRYQATHGQFPTDAFAGRFPEDFAGYLHRSLFEQAAPSGGVYDWDGPDAHAGSERLKIRFPGGTEAAKLPIYSILEEADDGLAASGWITADRHFIVFWP